MGKSFQESIKAVKHNMFTAIDECRLNLLPSRLLPIVANKPEFIKNKSLTCFAECTTVVLAN